MASDKDFVEYVVDQISPASEMSYKSMFGEYGLYSKGKIVAVICDNQLFVKPTEPGKTFIGNYQEAPPYPGAKPSLLITDKIEDGEWLTELIDITEKALPMPKPKKKKNKKK